MPGANWLKPVCPKTKPVTSLKCSPCDILLALRPMTSNRTARRIISRIQHREPTQSMLRKVPARLYVRWSARCDTNNISTKQRRLGECSAEWHAHDSDDEHVHADTSESTTKLSTIGVPGSSPARNAPFPTPSRLAPSSYIEKAPAVVVLLKTSANGASRGFG